MSPPGKPFKLKRPEPTEAVVLYDVLACLKQLQAKGKVVWYARFNTAAGKLQYGESKASQFMRFAFKGCPDVIGQLVGGASLLLEVKRPSGLVSADQAAFLEKATAGGACAGVVRSIDDVLELIEGYRRVPR